MRTIEEINADIKRLEAERQEIRNANASLNLSLLNKKYANKWIKINKHTTALSIAESEIIPYSAHFYKVKKVTFQGYGFFRFDADIHILIELDDEEKLVFSVERDVEEKSVYESRFERDFASIVDESEANEWIAWAKSRFEQLYTLI